MPRTDTIQWLRHVNEALAAHGFVASHTFIDNEWLPEFYPEGFAGPCRICYERTWEPKLLDLPTQFTILVDLEAEPADAIADISWPKSSGFSYDFVAGLVEGMLAQAEMAVQHNKVPPAA